MKTIYLLPFIFLCVSSHISAQNYQSFYSNRTLLFEGDNHEIKAIRFDSLKYTGDSVFYPFKNIDAVDIMFVSPYAPSWIGEKIIICSNKLNLFFNREKDTIKIKTDAKVNESWEVYKKGRFSIVARVNSTDTLSFLGIKDSVKTIGFQAYENSNTIEHAINSKIIKLSKKYGMVVTLNFKFFPDLEAPGLLNYNLQQLNLAGIKNPKAGIQNLKWKEVFDFKPGDEFHTFYYSYSGFLDEFSYDSVYLTKKYLFKEIKNDTIIYKYDRKRFIISHSEGKVTTSFIQDTIEEIIFNNYEFDKLPGEPIIGDQLYCYSMFNDSFLSKMTTYKDLLIKASDSTWHMVVVDGCLQQNYYMKAFGSLSEKCSYFDFRIENYFLYYKKGNFEWGKPIKFDSLLTRKPEIVTRPEIVLSQNSAGKGFTVTSAKELPLTLELLDLNGKIQHKATIRSSEYTFVNEKDLRGIYLYRLMSKNAIIKTGKIILR